MADLDWDDEVRRRKPTTSNSMQITLKTGDDYNDEVGTGVLVVESEVRADDFERGIPSHVLLN